MNERVAVAHQALDRADQQVGEVGDVRHQVGHRAAARLLAVEPPRQHPVRLARVTGQEAAAEVGDGAQPARPYQAKRILHQRRPAVIVAHPADRTRRPRRRRDRRRLVRVAPHRLLAEQVLARFDGGQRDRCVQGVLGGDVNHLHLRVVHRLAPVGGSAIEAHLRRPFKRARRHVVRTHHQMRLHAQLREAIPQLPVGARVHRPHPAHADHRHPQRPPARTAHRIPARSPYSSLAGYIITHVWVARNRELGERSQGNLSEVTSIHCRRIMGSIWHQTGSLPKDLVLQRTVFRILGVLSLGDGGGDGTGDSRYA